MVARRRKRGGRGDRLARSVVRLARQIVLVVAVTVIVLPPLGALVFAVLPVSLTPLMVIRMSEGEGLVRIPIRLTDVSPAVLRAVIASEDSRFCSHHGFDVDAIEEARRDSERGRPLRGASTLSQQVAKNVFLWPGRSWVRKGLEAYTTVFIEGFWSKRRILETYLNIAEWGPGLYGIEAAARYNFQTTAKALSPEQAARLAVILPNPREWRANPASRFVAAQARLIERRMGEVEAQGLARCVGA